MKENNNIEFDQIFKQELENTSTPVPEGLWEGISSSIGSSAGIATVAVKTAIWMKAAIAASVIGVVSVVTYQVFIKEDKEALEQPVIIENTTESANPDGMKGNGEIEKQDHTAMVTEANPHALKHGVHPFKQDRNLKEPEIKQDIKDLKGPDPEQRIEFKLEDTDYSSKTNENGTDAGDSAKTSKGSPDEQSDKPFIAESVSPAYLMDSSYLYIPNVVTPNGDGLNDEYKIDIRGEESVSIIIYNSKNVKLFETKNKYFGWDCKLPNGEIAPEGNYIVKVTYKFKNKAQTTTTTKLKLIK